MNTTATMRAPAFTNLRWLWLAVLVIALDQSTKHLVVASLRRGRRTCPARDRPDARHLSAA